MRTSIAVHGRRSSLQGPLRGEYFRVLFDRDLLAGDLLPDHTADDCRDFRIGELNRTEKRIGFADVRGLILKCRDNNAGLVLGCHRRVTPGWSEGRADFALADHWRKVKQ